MREISDQHVSTHLAQRCENSLELQDLLPLVARLDEEANGPVRLEEDAVGGDPVESLDGIDLAPLRVQKILRNLLHLEGRGERVGCGWSQVVCGYVEYMHTCTCTCTCSMHMQHAHAHAHAMRIYEEGVKAGGRTLSAIFMTLR